MATPELWLVQYLCPSRHAIGASPYDRTVTEPIAAERALLAELSRFGVLAFCGICGSRTLRFEHGRLPFTDWTTALAALRALEDEQRRSRAAIDAARQDRN